MMYKKILFFTLMSISCSRFILCSLQLRQLVQNSLSRRPTDQDVEKTIHSALDTFAHVDRDSEKFTYTYNNTVYHYRRKFDPYGRPFSWVLTSINNLLDSDK